MYLVGTRTADKDGIALLREEVVVSQPAKQGLIDRGSGELELGDVFSRRQLGDGHT